MTREQFLSQYTGEWSPSDGHWFGLDFGWRGQEYRFQTDSMYHPVNTILPDGREARFGVYKNDSSFPERGSCFFTADKCLLNGKGESLSRIAKPAHLCYHVDTG